MDDLLTNSVMTFGQFRFDRRFGELSRRGGNGVWAPVTIGSRAAAILGALLRNPGAVVSKDALMDVAWPSTTVEANNLTVQIAALRRALDEGGGDSLIQTVPARGYRFVGVIEEAEPAASISRPPQEAPMTLSQRALPRRRLASAAACAAIACGLVSFGAWHYSRLGATRPPPRVSLIVLPFQNLGGDPNEDYLANTVTDDIVTRLLPWGLTPDAMRSISPAAAKGVDLTPNEVRRRFDVRYMLSGSVRRLGTMLRVNMQLLSTETGGTIGTERFDVSFADLDAAQQEIARRVSFAARLQVIAAEDARSRRERPDNPDGLDLVIRAGALESLPPSPDRLGQIRDLYEQAVQRDPASAAARVGLVIALLDGEDGMPRGRKAILERTRELLVTLRYGEPAWWGSMLANLHWLSWQDRCPETINFAQTFISTYPDFAQVYRWLGDCQTRVGLAQEALPALTEAANRDQGQAWESHDDRNLQYAFLLLGRYDDSISWGTRALVDDPQDMARERGRIELRLAAAHALAGHLDQAKRHLENGIRLDPSATLRQAEVGRQASPAYADQLARVIEGLRLAGLRDHADEHADFGVPADDRMRQNVDGRTPMTVPGANTIDTDALSALLAEEKPIVIDTLQYFAGRSIPGAVGLDLAGSGGNVSDLAQDHLRAIVRELTHGNLDAPVVALGWSSESFGGRNLTLRLVTLGYTNVYWYRGGREAWEVRQLPEADLVATDW